MSLFKLHKDCYYGIINNNLNNSILKKFYNTLYYCICIGCRKNIEFADFIDNNFHFSDDNYKVCITSCYLTNGIYNDKLYLDRVDYRYLVFINENNINKLIKYENIHYILGYTCLLNGYVDLFNKLNIKEYNYMCNNLIKYYNIPNILNTETKYEKIHPRFNIFSNPDNTLDFNDYIFDLDFLNIDDVNGLYTYNEDELLKYNLTELTHISSFEKAVFLLYYLNKENVDCGFICSESDLYNNIEFALKCYNSNNLIEQSLCKMVAVDSSFALKFYKTSPCFLRFINQKYDLSYIDEYMEINKLLKFNFIYSNIMLGEKIEYEILDKYCDDYVDYSLVEACIYSCNIYVLFNLYNLSVPCYKRLDFLNNKFIDSNDEINWDFYELLDDVKFDLNKYKNLYY